jgi:hypothetical protein
MKKDAFNVVMAHVVVANADLTRPQFEDHL